MPSDLKSCCPNRVLAPRRNASTWVRGRSSVGLSAWAGRQGKSERAQRYATRGGLVGLIWALYLAGSLILKLEEGVWSAAAGFGFGLAALATTFPASVLTSLLGAAIESLGFAPGRSGFIFGFFVAAVLNYAAIGYAAGLLVGRIERTRYWKGKKSPVSVECDAMPTADTARLIGS